MRRSQRAFTLLELLVVVALIAIMVGLLLAAVQKTRSRALQVQCSQQLRQLALALHQYHDVHHRFPPGHRPLTDAEGRPYSGWTMSILPYLEHDALWAESLADYRAKPIPFRPSHRHLATVVKSFACPADPRVTQAQIAKESQVPVAFTSYLGVAGRDALTRDGVLFQGSGIALADITDGTSHTLLLGERPPSHDYQFGWWYAGVGQRGTGSADLVLGVREQNLLPIVSGSSCGPGAYAFRPAAYNDPCGMFHFWSPHGDGAHFALADGSVRLVRYSAAALLPELASRAGGEGASVPE